MQSVGLGSLAILNWPQVWMWVLALQQTTDLWACVLPSIKPGIFCTLADMQTPTLQLRIKYPKLKSVYFSIKVNISKFLCNLTKLFWWIDACFALWWVFTTAGRSFQLKRFQTTVEVYFRLCTQTVSFLFWLLLAAIKANIMFYDLFHRKRVYISYNRVNSSVFVTVILDWRDLSKFLFATWGRLFFMLLFRKKEEKKDFILLNSEHLSVPQRLR